MQPALVNAVLERALTEHRPAVILGAVRDLGERKEIRSLRPMERGQPPMVRALHYPDRRVQMAAAEALLQIPDSAASLATTCASSRCLPRRRRRAGIAAAAQSANRLF